MAFKKTGLIVVALAMTVTTGTAAQAGPIQVGGTYNVTNTNFPNSFTSGPLTINSTAKPIGGAGSGGLTVRERITDTSSEAQWIEWIFEKTDAPLADVTTGGWKTEIFNVPVTTPVIYDGFFIYWTINGTAAQNITTIPGLGAPQVNPLNPAHLVYGGFFPAEGPFTGPLSFDAFLTNYGLGISDGNMDINQINGFVVGAHLTTATGAELVPEPASITMLAIGGIALCGYGWRRKRRTV
ncbi:hypothetical protein CA54_34940 [Symmachiella macrocystis]|uniref:Ice-binding protein C-terminal domain-containing protein n=1 Tax=Symmachiella macrocystis TaxID=2527985 RepID=A0A5C6BRQ0_9PLAN|nr:PEP-CTERM sorting domain-containing protein [Symmachiella macrocystis]TWU14625.1 hypothetical protein CA54_34940 [Symmachiella macrocystis]